MSKIFSCSTSQVVGNEEWQCVLRALIYNPKFSQRWDKGPIKEPEIKCSIAGKEEWFLGESQSCGSNSSPPARNMNGLQVLFWNGRQVTVPGDLAVWISPSLYERIVRELQWAPPGIPRRCFLGQCCHGDKCHPPWPSRNFSCSLGCPLPASLFSCSCRQWRPLPLSTCHVISLRGEEEERPWEDLERKVNFQLKELQEERKIPSSSSSLSSGGNSDTSDGALKSSGVQMMSQATNTDLCLLHKPSSASPGRPQWKYWRRSQTEPQYKLSSGPVHSKYPALDVDQKCQIKDS